MKNRRQTGRYLNRKPENLSRFFKTSHISSQLLQNRQSCYYEKRYSSQPQVFRKEPNHESNYAGGDENK
jgi:hypothetical protein